MTIILVFDVTNRWFSHSQCAAIRLERQIIVSYFNTVQTVHFLLSIRDCLQTNTVHSLYIMRLWCVSTCTGSCSEMRSCNRWWPSYRSKRIGASFYIHCEQCLSVNSNKYHQLTSSYRGFYHHWCTKFRNNTGVPFNVSLSIANLSYRQPEFAGISRECSRAQGQVHQSTTLYCERPLPPSRVTFYIRQRKKPMHLLRCRKTSK